MRNAGIVVIMTTFLVPCLGLFLLIAGSCSTEPQLAKIPWSLKLTTSGGFGGRGMGTLTVDSEGNYAYDDGAATGATRKECKGKFSSRQLQPISDAVVQSQPREWNRKNLSVAAPDAFGYKLELRTDANMELIAVQWYDNTADQLPPDL